MNKKDEIKIEVLSSIKDEIIDKQTEKRFSLLQKNRYSRKKLAGWISAAAGAVAACVVLFSIILPLLDGSVPVHELQVPIYEGMTVSNTAPTSQLNANIGADMPMLLASEDYGYEAVMLADGDAEGEAPEATESILDSISVDGADRSLYYANKNEDIYITIHINNPEEFEILSFTLNGLKYQSYMFEAGSDSEALILKVNVGDAEGMIEYTIDAIKYVEGTEIKDVRMDGDRTVRIGVYPDDQPTVNIENKLIEPEAVGFEVSLEDVHSLIKDSDGELFAALYYGDEMLERIELSADEVVSAKFSSLTPGEEYTYRIIACYDALDGKGFDAHILYEERVRTEVLVQIKSATVTDGVNIVFELTSENASVTIDKIELISASGDVAVTIDGSARIFERAPIGEYVIKVSYSYGTDGSGVGYAYSSESLKITKMGTLDDIVRDAVIVKEYNHDMHVFNPTTGDYRPHFGIDVKNGGTDNGVYTPFSGVVTEVSGGKVSIQSNDPRISLVLDSLAEITVSVGDAVTFGQKIGVISNKMSSEAADEPHAHVELWINGEDVDPTEFFS